MSAVVLNWKDNARTLRCLEPLLSSSIVEHIYIVDNETDETLSTALADLDNAHAHTWTLCAFGENRGFAGGVNVGLHASMDAGFDAVLVINNDATIDDRSVAILLLELEQNPQLGLVGPRILHADGTEESAGGFVKPLLGITTHRTTHEGTPDFITWACILVRARALEEVGLLDERFFMYWEDVDFSFRLRAADWGLAVCADAQAVHEISSNRARYPTTIKAYHTWSSVLFAKKHGGRWRSGNRIWLFTSAAANLARCRLPAVRGLKNGVALAREEAVPAYENEMRTRLFGHNEP